MSDDCWLNHFVYLKDGGERGRCTADLPDAQIFSVLFDNAVDVRISDKGTKEEIRLVRYSQDDKEKFVKGPPCTPWNR